jgi:hypothetical protein
MINQRYQQIVSNWLESNIEQRGYARYDDLSLEMINPVWRSREHWVESGLEMFKLAVCLRDQAGIPEFEVAMVFSLQASTEARGIDFSDRTELEANLDWSPPSLYLFERGKEPWSNPSQAATEGTAIRVLRTDIFQGAAQTRACYYMEFRPSDSDEYSRTVMLVG